MSAPGRRFSPPSEVCSPTMRNPAVRLSRLQTTAVGAQDPSWYLLYELTNGANIQAISRAVDIRPPREFRNVSDMWWGSWSSHIRDSDPSSFHTLEWT